jgi:hypoxanthine phosphoribosyltransferase
MKTIDLSWRDIDNLVSTLAKKINKRYDVIIGLNRGGLVASVLLSHITKTKHGVVSVESYQGKRKSGKHKLDYHVSMIGQLNSKTKILLVDDISDTGESLREIMKVMHKLGCKIENIDTATLHYKSRSCFKPTYFAKHINDADWINYTWEKK